MRRIICLLIALPLLLPAQDTEPSLHMTTSEVLLDIVVRDKKAHIVRDLKPEEVQVFEDGVPQKLRRFNFFDGHATPDATPTPAAAPATATTTAPAQPLNVQELREVSVVTIVVANLDPRGRKFALDTVHEFIQNDLNPSTYVGIYTLEVPAGLHKLQPYTNDPVRIATAMERAVGAVFNQRPKMAAQDPRDLGSSDDLFRPDTTQDTTISQSNASAVGPAQVINQITENQQVNDMQDAYADSMNYLAPLRNLVQSQADIPGRKVMLLLSSGLPVHFETADFLNNVISTSNRSNVTIYAVDTRGFDSRSDMQASNRMLAQAAAASRRRQVSLVNGGDQTVQPMEVMAGEIAAGAIHANPRANLAQLAEGTGGKLLSDSTDLKEPLRRALEEVRTHYELSYSPANSAADGTFRKIQVKVTRPGVTVFARSGYYALPTINGRQIYPFEMATMQAINTKPMLHQFEMHSTALQFRTGPAQDQMAFVFESPAKDLSITKDKEWAGVHVCVTALIKNEKGLVVNKISKDIQYQVPVDKMPELQRGVVSFTTPFQLAPGRYTLETAAVDQVGTRASVRRSSLIVSETPGLSMSDVSVVRRVDQDKRRDSVADPLEAGPGKVVPELLNVVSPDNGQVTFYAVAYPPAPIDGPVQVSVEIWRDGQLVVKTPNSDVPADSTGAASILAGVPMNKLTAGQYEARIWFEYKGQKVTRETAFSVGSGS